MHATRHYKAPCKALRRSLSIPRAKRPVAPRKCQRRVPRTRRASRCRRRRIFAPSASPPRARRRRAWFAAAASTTPGWRAPRWYNRRLYCRARRTTRRSTVQARPRPADRPAPATARATPAPTGSNTRKPMPHRRIASVTASALLTRKVTAAAEPPRQLDTMAINTPVTSADGVIVAPPGRAMSCCGTAVGPQLPGKYSCKVKTVSHRS